jgi:hypothetical protein
LGEHVEQASIEAVDGIVWHGGEQLAREATVIVEERLRGGVSLIGEGDQRRAAVGRMRLAGHEPGGRQAVHQTGNCAGSDAQVCGQRALGAWSALLKLPEQVDPRLAEPFASEEVGHVAAKQHRQLKDPVESCLPPFSIQARAYDAQSPVDRWETTMAEQASSPNANVELVRAGAQAFNAGEFLGIPATSRAVEYVSHEFYRIADGLITEECLCSDMTTLLRQLG